MTPKVTFMIATHNRVDELMKTLASCEEQNWRNKEIMVVDDASSDGTYDLVRANFPNVNVVRFEHNRGSIAARNDILKRASGDYIVALDDDSRLIDAESCRRIVERMESEPDLGVIALQIIGPEYPERLSELGRLRGEWHCNSFAACAAVIRRSLTDKIGLFPEFFFHAYEEPDFCLRAWNAGYRVLQWNEVTVYHEFSTLNRNEQRTHHRHARNEACGVVMRYPWHLVIPGIIARLSAQFRYALRRGWGWREPLVWIDVLRRLPCALVERKPVSSQSLKIWIGLNRIRTSDPIAARRLENRSWWSIISARCIDSSPGTEANSSEHVPALG